MKIKERKLFEYECNGECGKKRKTLIKERAEKGICITCKRNAVDPNQTSLFDNDMKCQDCEKEKPDVSSRICPYAEDIHGRKDYVEICDDCYHERAMDI